MGKFEGDSGTFIGRAEFKGRPIVMRFRWLDIHSRRPYWEQAFSTDDGASWEVNWEARAGSTDVYGSALSTESWEAVVRSQFWTPTDS